MYSLIFVVSSWTDALVFTSPLPPSFHLVYSLRLLDLGWNSSCIEFLCLDISGLYLLPWPAHYTSGVFDDQQGMQLMAWSLFIQPTFQDLPNSL